MLFDLKNDLDSVLQSIRQELSRATVDRKHPFRLFVFTTVAGPVASRYVVLREVDRQFNFFIYTDSRSRKVKDIQNDKTVQCVFFHPRKRVQVVLKGDAYLIKDNDLIQSHWEKVKGDGAKAYTSVQPPGAVIENPTDAYEWHSSSNKYFSLIKIVPSEVEVLQLSGYQHIRAFFTKSDAWEGQWLVP